jgi:WhiB family redox-sensing transcriptional regulator
MTTTDTPTRLATNRAAHYSDWRGSASCQGIDLDTTFSDSPGTQKRVQGICRGCPVRMTCLSDVVAYEKTSYMRWGVVGGLTTVQRRALRVEALLGSEPSLKQARALSSPVWASRMMPLRQRGLTPAQIAVELRKHDVIASPVTVRLAVWWAGGKGGLLPRRANGDSRAVWEIVRDECRDVVMQLREMGAGNRDIAAYLQVCEDYLAKAVQAWKAQDEAEMAVAV